MRSGGATKQTQSNMAADFQGESSGICTKTYKQSWNTSTKYTILGNAAQLSGVLALPVYGRNLRNKTADVSSVMRRGNAVIVCCSDSYHERVNQLQFLPSSKVNLQSM